MNDDAEMLRRFAENQDQAAFGDVVRRHLPWVYRAGLRRTGGRSDLAQDVAQYVFLALAKNAASLHRRDSLSGWLYLTTRFAASRVCRAERRRRGYEMEAGTMSAIEQETAANEAGWSELGPVLDEVLDRLAPRDRETLMHRFFEDRGFAEIGALLGVGEDGARKRVDRALEKLRRLLAMRGVHSTATALGSLLGGPAKAAVAAEVQAGVASALLAGGSLALPGASALGIVHFMSATKTFAVVAGVAAAVMLSSIGVVLQELQAARASESALAEEIQRGAVEQHRLQALRAKNDESRTASAATAVKDDPASAPKGAVGPTPPTKPAAANPVGTPRADAEAFFAKFPQARAMEKEVARRQLARNYAISYRLVGLTPSEIQQFEARTLQYWSEHDEVTPHSIAPTGELSDEQLREIFGEEKFKKWQESNRPGAAQGFAKDLALAIGGATTPPTFDQVFQLATIFADHSPDYLAGREVKLAKIDWPAALEEARTVLTEEQWQEAQPFLLQQELERRLNLAMKKEPK
jgi:RNA polymerase sigma factor (sigma-70 family)